MSEPVTPIDNTPVDIHQSEQMMRALSLEEKSAKTIKFRNVSSIESLYQIGDEVMPSGSRGAKVKAVLYGQRKSDGKKVIIKLRNKRESFKDETEVQEWVTTMKVLYLISGAESQERPNSKGRLKLIANLVDIVEDSVNYYAIMEHVVGRDLFDFFVQEKIYTKPYKIDIAKQLAAVILEGIHELHSYGICHKDLKLENLVFDENNSNNIKQEGAKLVCIPKLIDFDTCELVKGPSHKTLHVLGTDQYIAPESYRGVVGFGCDIWALGVVLYTVLTGSFPFHYALFDDRAGENYVGHVRMEQIARRLRIAKIDWSARVWSEGAENEINNSSSSNKPPGDGRSGPILQGNLARDFVRSCFVCDPRRRLSVSQARNHPWLQDVRLPPHMKAPEGCGVV